MKTLFKNKLFLLLFFMTLAITATALEFNILALILWSYPVGFFLYGLYYAIKNGVGDLMYNKKLKSYTGIVSGIVKFENKPCEVVSVRVRNPKDMFDNSMSTYGAYTDSNGYFKISNIKNGNFNLVFYKQCHIDNDGNQICYKEKVININITDENNVLIINETLEREI